MGSGLVIASADKIVPNFLPGVVIQAWLRRVRYRDTPFYIEGRWLPGWAKEERTLHGLGDSDTLDDARAAVCWLDYEYRRAPNAASFDAASRRIAWPSSPPVRNKLTLPANRPPARQRL